jgi:hypothetical protein
MSDRNSANGGESDRKTGGNGDRAVSDTSAKEDSARYTDGNERFRLVTDEFGDFDRLEYNGEILVSELCENEVIDIDAELEARGFAVTRINDCDLEAGNDQSGGESDAR